MSAEVVLPRRLDGATVSDVTVRLIEAAKHDKMELNACETVHIGALGAQMLLSAQRSMQAKGGKFHLVALNDRIRDQLSIMGLSQLCTSETEQ